MIKIIFAAFNEAESLKKLLVNLNHELENLGKKFEIIICLDGTSDNSLEVIEEFQKFHPIRVLEVKNQRGLGLAFKRIFLDVIQNSKDDDLIVSMDADHTHDVEQISQMLEAVQSDNLDVLVASRFVDKSVMNEFPVHRRLISKIVSIVLQNLFPIKKINHNKLQDYTSGYRVYRAEKLKKLFDLKKDDFITEPEFTYTCELLIKLSRINCRISEIAISYDYGAKIGASKLRIIRNFVRLMFLILKLKAQK
jgi:dolichol-phosphate mannosyltransferase